jgi:hypothetical protein
MQIFKRQSYDGASTVAAMNGQGKHGQDRSCPYTRRGMRPRVPGQHQGKVDREAYWLFSPKNLLFSYILINFNDIGF